LRGQNYSMAEQANAMFEMVWKGISKPSKQNGKG